MPLPPRLFPGDEQLGKKDDDHKPGMRSPLGVAWQQRRLPHGPHRRTLKRAVLGLLVVVALYLFFKNMPADLENPRARPHYDHAPGAAPQMPPPNAPLVNQASGSQAGHEVSKETTQHYFNGPIKFYQLASSLHAVSRTKGSELINRNVVSLLQSVLEINLADTPRSCLPRRV